MFEASAEHDFTTYQDNMHWTIELIKFSPLVMHCGAKAALQKACLKWILLEYDIQHILFFVAEVCWRLHKSGKVYRMYSRKAQNPANIYIFQVPHAWFGVIFCLKHLPNTTILP